MQWRKESLLVLKGIRSGFTAPGKGKLWLVTELRLTGRERQLCGTYRLQKIPGNGELPIPDLPG